MNKLFLTLLAVPLLVSCGKSQEQKDCDRIGGKWKSKTQLAVGVDPVSGRVVTTPITFWYCSYE